MQNITLTPIGIIHSPYKQPADMPIQGTFRPDVEAWLELKPQYKAGLDGLEGFSHALVIYYFHKSDKEVIQGKPFLEDTRHGVFAMRSPHRPNHLGISIVKINRIEDNRVYFTEPDILDGTPLLDIKPYVKYFDHRSDVKCGWVDKHFQNGDVPSRTILPPRELHKH